MMLLSPNWYFSVQKALIYYTFNKSHHNSFILLVFSHVANFRYVANFRFLAIILSKWEKSGFFSNTMVIQTTQNSMEPKLDKDPSSDF